MRTKPVFNRAPLSPNAFSPLPLGSISPKGELLERLQSQANGLGGNLEKVWPSLRDNAWLGGSGDAWERGPYYFDGLIPLAYILKDARLVTLANRFVEWTLSSQDESGWFGPAADQGYWPRMVALKALKQHFEATGDKRVLRFMHRYFRCQYSRLDTQSLELWATARAGDNVLCALWLYNIVGDPSLLKLCKKLLSQAIDWTAHFSAFPHNRDLKREMPWSSMKPNENDQNPWRQDWLNHQLTHVVNIAMGLKTPALDHAISGGIKQAQAFQLGYERLMKAHGVANGMFTGDEHLSGASPSQGTETCAVVEMLFTLETLMGQLDDPALGDLFERIGFNALPAALSPDGWAHQYDQQANQIRISNQIRVWYNNGPDANVFGLEPNFGCCTANLHQGLPKFAQSLWMATRDGGLVCQSFAPCQVTTSIGGQRVMIDVDGNYPYSGEISIRVRLQNPASFPLKLRIPAWAAGADIALEDERWEPEAGRFFEINRVWQNGDSIRVSLPMQPHCEGWFHQSIAVYKGPILFALPIEHEWRYDGELPLCNRYAEPKSAWNFALIQDADFTIQDEKTITATAKQVLDWGESGLVADPPPVLPKGDGEKTTIRLIPYADAPLRISQFPKCRG